MTERIDRGSNDEAGEDHFGMRDRKKVRKLLSVESRGEIRGRNERKPGQTSCDVNRQKAGCSMKRKTKLGKMMMKVLKLMRFPDHVARNITGIGVRYI